MNTYIALLHYPVYNKKKEIVNTCITGFDMHDIARSCATFGIAGYYMVNPMEAQQQFAQRILNAWEGPEAIEHNWTRAKAFSALKIKADLAEVIEDIGKIEGKKPKIAATSAKAENGISFEKLKKEIDKNESPFLILFGTGWGMTDELISLADYLLEPIIGPGKYNHLSVRSAVAIILDRLFHQYPVASVQ